MIIREALVKCPFVAILRGILPNNALPVAEVLIECGFQIIEIPLNSPNPYESINNISTKFGENILVGAGTVLQIDEVALVKSAGGKIIVSPNVNCEVIHRSKLLNLISIPGATTPSEVISAIQAGADAIKLFPAEILPPIAIKALRAIIPNDTILLPVGGISTDKQISAYLSAGANGFGLGSALFKPGKKLSDIKKSAKTFINSIK